MNINWRVKLVPTRNWAVYFYIISLKKEAYNQESSKVNHALKRSRILTSSQQTPSLLFRSKQSCICINRAKKSRKHVSNLQTAHLAVM